MLIRTWSYITVYLIQKSTFYGDWNATSFVPAWPMLVSYQCGLGRRFDTADTDRKLVDYYTCGGKVNAWF